MNKLILTVGIPGSGKSTWSQQYIRENLNTVRVNSDRLREMLFAYNPYRMKEYWRDSNLQDRESIVRKLVRDMASNLLSKGHDVIIDAMNLDQAVITKFITIAEVNQASVSIKEFNTPLDTCIRRDQQRERHVGKIYITQKQEQFRKLKGTSFYASLPLLN